MYEAAAALQLPGCYCHYYQEVVTSTDDVVGFVFWTRYCVL